MKNLKIGLMMFLVVLASGSTMAQGALKVEVVQGKDEKALVDVIMAPNSKFEVKVIDSNGNAVYNDSKETSTYDYRRAYDFSDLDNGKYTFEVKMGDETNVNDLVVNDGNVQIINNEEQISPYFKLKGKFLEFSFPNTTENEARFLLYNNGTQHWVFQESLSPEFNISQELNLSKLEPGSYKAELISGEDTFNYSFKLD